MTLKQKLVLVVLVMCGATGMSERQWSELAYQQDLVSKRHECGVIAHDGKLYLIGGRRNQPTQVYDLKSGQWKNGAPLLMEMHHMQLVVMDGKIYVAGAMTGQFPGERPLTHIHVYDTATDAWSRAGMVPEHRRRGAAGVVVHERWIYLIAGIRDGHRGGHVTWVDRFNPVTGEWEELPDAPRARDHFSAVVVNTGGVVNTAEVNRGGGAKIVAAGGRTTSQSTGQTFELTVKEVDVYDIQKKEWTTLPEPIPTPRAGTAAVTVSAMGKDWAVIIGGESAAQKEAHREVEAVDVTTGRWVRLADLVAGRHGMGAGVDDGKIYVAAGSGNRGGGPELTSTEVIAIAEMGWPEKE